MAEMTIVIQAVDKATAEIAKVNKAVGGMASAVASNASATARSAATTRASMDNIAAGTHSAGLEFGKMIVAWKLTMRVLGSSSELSDAIGAVHSFSGTLVTAAANAVGLGDALRGMSTMAAIAGGEQRIQQLQEALDRLKESASWTPASLPGSDYAMREIAALEKEIGRIKDSVIIARRAIYTELGLETQTKLVTEIRKEVAATDAASAARKKLADETERQLRDTESIGLLTNSDKISMQAGAANVAVRDLVRIRTEIETAGVGFAGMSLEDSFDTINREIDEMRAVALGAAAALQGLKSGLSAEGAQALGAGVAASIKAANQALEDFEPAAIEAAEAVDGQLAPALGRIKKNSDDAIISVRELVKEADRATEQMADMFAGHTTDAFMEFIQGTKSAGEAFRDMITGIIADMLRMQMQSAFKSLFLKILGSAAGGAAGGAGGSGVYSGTGSGSMAPPLPPVSGPSVLEFQHGGTVNAGQTVLVGERGPEIFVPHQSGYVNNNANTMGGGGTTVNFVISAVDGPSVAAMLRREKDTIKAVVASAMATDTRFRASLN